ncbi:hypothetical protein DFAR_2690040 [Desulfarculales bacterium]
MANMLVFMDVLQQAVRPVLLMSGRGEAALALCGDLSPNAFPYLEKIDQSCQRAADLTRTMLTFIRMETGDKASVDRT